MAWTTFAEPNITNMTGMLTYANDVTNDYFGVMIPFGIFLVSFIAMNNYPTEKSLLASGFISTVLSILLRLLGIVPDWIIITQVILLFAGIIFFGKKPYQ